MNPENQKPGEENHLYRDMKCCLHACSVWDCPEKICVEDLPTRDGFRGGLTAYRRYQETLKVFQEHKDINEAAKALGIDPSNVRKRFKWLQSFTMVVE